MSKSDFEVAKLLEVLGKSLEDGSVQQLINRNNDLAVVTEVEEDGVSDVYYEFSEFGVALLFESGFLDTVFLYSGRENPDFDDYQLALPFGLHFNYKREDVLEKIGNPDQVGGGKEGVFGYVPKWVKYFFDGYYLHIEFAPEQKKIRMITLACV